MNKFIHSPRERNEQDKEREHRPQGVYTDVHDQGGAECDTVLRRLFPENYYSNADFTFTVHARPILFYRAVPF